MEDASNRNKLARLTRWHTSLNSTSLTSFDKYVANMKGNQDVIYFMAGESLEQILESPNL